LKSHNAEIITIIHKLKDFKEHSSMNADRYICLGRLHDVVTLFVVFIEQGENIHLIMARKAEPIEERLYYAHYEKEARGN